MLLGHEGISILQRLMTIKLELNESKKRDTWLSLRDASTWQTTNSEECDVVWHSQYFYFLHDSPLYFLDHDAP